MIADLRVALESKLDKADAEDQFNDIRAKLQVGNFDASPNPTENLKLGPENPKIGLL